jgi:hypothetical protein
MRPELWKRVSNLFELALDVAPDQRDAWLKSACGYESDIEAAVWKLLRADDHAAAKEFLEASYPKLTVTRKGPACLDPIDCCT